MQRRANQFASHSQRAVCASGAGVLIRLQLFDSNCFSPPACRLLVARALEGAATEWLSGARDRSYCEPQSINKDGRLIRLDYVLRKASGAWYVWEHNQSIRTPRLLFLSFGFQGTTAI
jgi:hypothetical protein